MGYTSRYSGDFAAALADYNAGSVPIDRCKLGHDPAWLTCLSRDVQDYVLAIIFYPDTG